MPRLALLTQQPTTPPPLAPPTQVDQQELETVVPQPGGSVLVLNGAYRGTKGTLQSIDTKRFQVGQGRAGWGRAGRRAAALNCCGLNASTV